MPRRPLHLLTVAATAAHHGFELGAGVGLVFQPYLGLPGAALLWSATLPAWALAAARGSHRWDRPLAFLAGMAVGGAAVHYTLWPWEVRGCLPRLTEAEGLRPSQLPAYNALLQAWALAALAAVLVDSPRGARRWAGLGVAAALPLRASARHHFGWLRAQAEAHPAWWNRALRPPLSVESERRDARVDEGARLESV